MIAKLRPFNRAALGMRIVALKFDQRGPEWEDRAREMRESADMIDTPEAITTCESAGSDE